MLLPLFRSATYLSEPVSLLECRVPADPGATFLNERYDQYCSGSGGDGPKNKMHLVEIIVFGIGACMLALSIVVFMRASRNGAGETRRRSNDEALLLNRQEI